MLIERLQVENWCQLEQADVEFTPGYNAILGKNGAGKSNLIAALQYAISGTTKFLVKRYIGPKQNSASVTVTFRLGDTRYSICRKLYEKKPAKIMFGSAKEGQSVSLDTIGSRDLNKQMTILGVNPVLFDRYIVVPQSRTTEWLKLKNTERDSWFSTLFDLDRFRLMFEAVDGRVKYFEQELSQYQSQEIVQLEAEIVARKKLLAQFLRKHEEIAAKHPMKVNHWPDVVDELKRVIECADIINAKDKLLSQLRKKLKLTKTEVTDGEIAAAEAAAAFDKEKALSERKSQTLKTCEAAIAQTSADLRRSLTRDKFATTVVDLVARLADLPPQPTEQELQTYQELLSRQQTLTQQKVQMELAIEKSAGFDGEPCPTCGQTIGEHSVKGLQDELKEVIKQIQGVAKQLKKIPSYVSDSTKISTLRDRLNTELQINRKALEDFSDLPDETNFSQQLKELNSEKELLVRQAEIMRRKTESVFETLKSANYKLQGLRLELTRLESDIKDTDKEKTSAAFKLTKSFERLAELDFEIEKPDSGWFAEKLSALESDLSELKSTRQMLKNEKTEIASLEAQVQKIREDDTSKKLLEGHLQAASELRDWLHPSKAPRTIASRMLSRLFQELNAQLSYFGSPFIAEIDKELQTDSELMVRKGEMSLPAYRLSGGEQTMLSLAFWFSLPRVLRFNFGTLVLDEPTQDLDQTNLEFLRQTMLNHMNSPEFKNRQILVVTHAQPLVSSFQNVVNL